VRARTKTEIVLQWSVFAKLDNCVLCVNPDSYCTIFKIFCTPSTLSRFLLAWNVKYRNQTLIFDDDVTKRLSEIRASSFDSRHPHSEKPSEMIFALWTRLEVAVARPEHRATSILFIFGLSIVLTKWS
jgi:hypothetical protein